ncbi:hypothetical protein ACHAWO_007734 [Cyclotella atomus]|uniref:Uncharacterized protein n=1 Tax=Cyclotella atomus TaxID=382360 RepID=A0ABD3N239_9STRA
MDRRDIINSALAAAIIGSQIIPSASNASDGEQSSSSPATILKGVVTLKSGSEASISESSALYITAKPETTMNAPKKIQELFAGRPPPVLTARYPITSGSNDAFPFIFQLTESDVTAEGAYIDENEEMKAIKYWWKNDNLVVSVRFDSDGIAATRDPDDLVGRSFSFVGDKGDGSRPFRYDKDVEVQLQGRGIGGKFITTKGR